MVVMTVIGEKKDAAKMEAIMRDKGSFGTVRKESGVAVAVFSRLEDWRGCKVLY